ncbi:MAG TPA: FlgD immunoglobulin-like domain containing protein [Rectinemataceae bacterium]|nr:FlgD immunoglobulin-like domain containing protein [Rectinemataceae bacterium]
MQNGTGLNSIGSNITTTNTALSFATGVTLTAGVQFSTQASVGAGNISFGSSIDGAFGTIFDSGTGTLTISGAIGAATPPSGLNVTQSGLATFNAVTIVGDLTLHSTDLDFLGAVQLSGTGRLFIYTRTGAETIGLGTATGTMTLSNPDLQSIQAAKAVTIGESGVQSAAITSTGALFFSGVTGLGAITLNSNSGAGAINLNDPATTALDINGNTTTVLTLNAGTGGIVATNAGTNASIANIGAGSSTLLATNSATGATNLGTAANGTRIVFSSASQPVRIQNANGSGGTVALRGLGPLTIDGGSASVTGNRIFDVDTSGATSDLIFNQQINLGSGNLSLSPARNIAMGFSGTAATPSILSTGSSMSFASPMLLNANTYISEGAGAASKTIAFGAAATLDDGNTATHSFTIDGGSTSQASISFGAAIGAIPGGNLASLTISNASSVSMANVGSSAIPQIGVSGALSVSTTGAISWTGMYYSTGNTQTWYAGGSLATPTAQILQTSAASTTWLTTGKLNLYGNFTAAGSGTVMTLESNDIGLNPVGATYGSWDLAGNEIAFYTHTQLPSTAMMVGIATGSGDTANEWHLDQSEMGSLNVASLSASQVLFGSQGTQTGNITFQNANFSSANVNILAFTDGAASGDIFLDDANNAISPYGLKTGSGAITLTAGHSIRAAQSQNPYPEIDTTGAVNLDGKAAYVGIPSVDPLQIQYYATTIVNLQKYPAPGTTAPSGAWIEGIGGYLSMGTVNVAGPITADVYSGGIIYLTKDVNTGGASLTYGSPVQLKPSSGTTITLTSSGGNVSFADTLDDYSGGAAGTDSLTVSAGSGIVSFTGPVGATKSLAALTISSAADATFAATVSATSFTQTAGSGTTTFNGNQSYSGAFAFTGTNLTVNKPWSVGGTTTVTNSGLFTTATANAAPLTSTGIVHQNGGGTSSLGSDITTTNAAVTFDKAVVLTSSITVSGGATGANLTFSSTIDAASPGSQGLTLTAGAGTVTFTGSVGGGQALAYLSVTSTNLAANAILASSSVKTVGAQDWYGKTTLNGNLSSTGAGGNISFHNVTSPVTLSNTITIDTSGGGGNLSLGGNLDAASAGMQGLTLVAGAGNIAVTGSIGTTQLGALSITSAANATLAGTVSATSFTQTAGSGTTTFIGNQSYSGAFAFTGTNLTVNNPWSVGSVVGTTTVTNSGLFTTATLNAAPLTSTGIVHQNGGGTSSLGSDIATMNAAVTFDKAVVLTSPITVSGGATGANLTFSSTIDAASPGSQGLTLTAGAGTVTFTGAVGGGQALAYLSVTSTNLAANAILASSSVKSVGAQDWYGKTTLNGNLSSTGAGGNISFHNVTSPVTLSNTITIDTSGGGGNLSFGGNLDAASAGIQGLTLVAGTGNILVTGPVGTTQLGALSITSAANATFTNAVSATSFTQTAGSGTTTFTGNQAYGGVFAFTGTNLTVTKPWSVGGTTTVTNSGMFTTATLNAAPLTSTGIVHQNGGGTSSLGSDITTTNAAVTFDKAMVLTSSITVSSQSAAGIGDLTFSSTIDAASAGTEGLTLVAGSGNIAVTGPVGTTQLGAVAITSAANATFTGAVNATSFTQAAGSGTTTFNGNQSYSGSFAFTGTSLTLNAPLTTSGGGTVTITNSGLATFNGDIASDGPVTENGAGTVTITAPRAIATTGDSVSFANAVALNGGSGSLVSIATTAGANPGGAGITFSSLLDATTAAPNAEKLKLDSGTGGALIFDGAVGGSVHPLTWLEIHSAGSITSSSSVSMPNVELYIDAPTSTILFGSNLDAKKLVLYNGTLNLNGKTLSTSADFVAYGPNYSPTDHDWLPATNTRFAYPGALSYTPSGYGAYTGAGSGIFASQSSPTFTGAFVPLGSSTITVGGNFYVNGADMNGAAWTLNIPNNSASHPVLNASATPTVAMWGTPYAVAFNLTVTNCTAGPGWVSAVVPVGAETGQNVNPTSTGVNWQFSRPDFSAVSTTYDDVIKLTFTMRIENSNDEIWQVVNASSTGSGLGGIWYNIPTATNPGLTPIQLLGAYIDPTCATPTTGNGDLTTFYLRIVKTNDVETDTSRWNTDATGTSSGAATSTDRGRTGVPPAHRVTVPDLSFLKGLFYAANGKTMARGYDTNISTSPYSATIDGCSPILISVRTGQETHLDPSAGQQPYDSHNYFDIQWSEPVSIGDLPAGSTRTNVRSESSFASAAEHGGHYSGSGTATLAGFFTVSGSATAGATVGVDTTLASPTTTASQSSNSLYRSAAAPEKLRVYLAGFAEAATTINSAWTWYWPGWMDNLSMPSGAIAPVANSAIVDLTGNPIDAGSTYASHQPSVDDASVLSPNGGFLYTNLPVVLASSSGTDGAWDSYNPTVALVRSKTDWSQLSGEIVPLEIADPTVIDRIEFHFLDNGTFPLTTSTPEDMTQRWATKQGWIGDTITTNFNSATSFLPPPDTRGGARPEPAPSGSVTAQTSGGLRDSTLNSVALSSFGFWDINSGGTSASATNSYNLSFETYVLSTLFNTSSVNVHDDPYFAIALNQTQPVAQRWGPNSAIHVSYAVAGGITDLAGNRLHGVADINAFERIAPKFRLALAVADSTQRKIYIQFSKNVNVDQLVLMGPIQLDAIFSFSATTPIHVVSAAYVDPGASVHSQDEIMLTVDRNVTAGDILGATFNVVGVSVQDPVTGLPITGSDVVDAFGTPLSPSETHRISDLGLNVINVTAATDGVHDTANPVLNSGQTDAATSALGALRLFDGTGNLLYRDITIYTAQNTSGSPATNLPLQLSYDVAPASSFAPTVSITGRNASLGEVWLPAFLPGFNSKADTDARSLSALGLGGAPNYIRDFRIPASDSEMKVGVAVGFLLNYGGLYCLRATDPDDPRQFDLYRYGLKDVTTQRGSVTILNNVINPSKGERTAVQVVLPKAVTMAVTIFTLDGDLIKRLYLGQQAAGTYTFTWDGRNLAGDAVARGIYFVRVVAGDIDEIRKVMVVK